MPLTAFTHGIVLAIGLIVALGPQNVFVFQQGAAQPRLTRALPTVLTAGISDTLLILLAVLGVSVVVLQFAWLQTVLFGAGFVFLLYIGWALYSSPALDVDPHTEEFLGTSEQIGFTASVSLLNPHAILDTIGVIGTNALAYSRLNRWIFTAGCLFVSWGWFSGLAVAGWALGESANADRWMRYLNTVSAVVVWLVALYMGWQLIGSLEIV
ncbi:LysE/ArgO family amino acid transporter [Natrialba aegyptia]|uniref:LysE family transporter n=1 Tax=Natrialba aegyptia DSM 13077 TaxID=1227491 RepID=M0AWH1_9EURY|nr:LysE family transporter [Natrialba aegyptia]ELZ02323.1 LysE family transporter [Natrialba aegyptia DSM 13077]